MRLTSLASPAALLLITPLLACPPPSSESDGSADTSSTGPTGDGDGDTGDESPVIICTPDETRCLDEQTIEICAPTGLSWDQVPCEGYETCDPNFLNGEGEQVATCLGPCEQLEDTPSSEGCSFYTTSMYLTTSPEKPPDAIVVGNPQVDRDATVTLNWVPANTNKEEIAYEVDGKEIENPVVIAPGESHVFELDPNYTIYDGEQDTSLFRSGSVYHVTSDLPVIAYLHTPGFGANSNASTLLLPESVLQEDYLVYSHRAWIAPNYFTVIAMQDQTTVTWRPSVDTAGDFIPIDFIEAGDTGMQLLNRFDNMRIDTSSLMTPKCNQDLSGTIIQSDKPIWVISAIRALRLPFCGNAADPGCEAVTEVNAECNRNSDLAMEQNLPLDYWGREYVGPHSPVRGVESHHWRVYAGEDDVTVTVTPPQPDTPFTLDNRGDSVDLVVPTGTHLEFDGDGVFMPIQYVTNHHDAGVDIGSPAMVQMVPTAQYLDRYVFVTANGYIVHYVQVIRPLENVDFDVVLDGAAITPDQWEAVGEWQIATIEITEGAHEIASERDFGIVQYGYSEYIDAQFNSAGYGYPGGMKAEVLFIP